MVVNSLESLDLSKLYTYKDYFSWKFEERVELIKGRIFPMSPGPNRFHQEISVNLTREIALFFKDHPCKIYTAPFDVRLPRVGDSSNKTQTVVQPDLCVICDLNKLDDKGCFGAPDLVVEILSPGNSKKEMSHKFEVYEESGVREYWLINPLDRNVIIYLLNESGVFVGQKPLVEEMTLTSYIFPDLSIELEEIFRQ